MAKLVLPVVGATIGFFVAGPTGAQWGWALGSMASAVLLAPDQEGPRLADLSTGGSEYGRPIPLCYGTTKVAGNVIWASDLIETENSESAKGGPEITTYSYSQHVQVLVCAGPVAGIRKIWANGRLIFDMSDTNTGSTGQSGNIRVYTGTETQVADSLIESYKGAGNVPAHRGYCHVVFENLQLEDYGNRTPSFEFEVVADGAVSYGLATVVNDMPPVPGSPSSSGDALKLPGSRVAMAQTVSGYITMYIVDELTGDVIGSGTSPNLCDCIRMVHVESVREIWCTSDYPARPNQRFDADTGAFIGVVAGSSYDVSPAYSSFADRVVVTSGPLRDSVEFLETDGTILKTLSIGLAPTVFRFMTAENAVLWTDARADWSTKTSLQLIDVSVMTYGPVIDSTLAPRSSKAITTELAYDSARRRVIWTHATAMPDVAIVDIDTLAVTYTTTDAPYTSRLIYIPDTDRLYAFGSPGGGETSVIIINADTLQMETQFVVTSGGFPKVAESIMTSILPHDWILTRTPSGLVKTPISPRLAANQVALSSIVTDLCERAGLTASDIDVTDLTDMVDGYKTT